MRAVAVSLLLAGGVLAGCSTLPTAGPTARDVEHENREHLEYVDVDDPLVTANINTQAEYASLRLNRPASV